VAIAGLISQLKIINYDKIEKIKKRSVDLVAEGEDNESTLRLMISRCVFPS